MKLALSVAVAAALAAVVPATAGAASSTGTGTVFLPNPVADLQNQSLTDQKDADYPALQAAYHDVTLTNLDGSGKLVGDWVNIHSQTGKDAFSPTNTFRFHRDQDGFEQVMATTGSPRPSCTSSRSASAPRTRRSTASPRTCGSTSTAVTTPSRSIRTTSSGTARAVWTTRR